MRLSSFINMSAASSTTVLVGLNSALQKRFVLEKNNPLIPGNVHRAQHVQSGVGGKGQDVAVTLSCLQFKNDVQLAQFLGKGPEGDLVYSMLQDLLLGGSDDDDSKNDSTNDNMQLTVRTESGMRTCTSIVASDSTTELVEPSGVVTKDEQKELMVKLALGSTQGRAGALCIMGSMPPGCPPDMYANIYKTVTDQNTLCLIDSVVGLEPLLETIAVEKEKLGGPRPTILKINASELCRLADVVQKNTESSSSEADGVETDELVQAILGLLNKIKAAKEALSAIAITDGAHPAYFFVLPVASDENECRLFQVPIAKLSEQDGILSVDDNELSGGGWDEMEESSSSLPTTTLPPMIYPIGAGDSVAAGTLAAWKFLTTTSTSSRQQQQEQQQMNLPRIIHPDIQAALAGNESPATRAMLTAFSFGLACGTASCLQEQNSVVNVRQVLNLYNKEGRPIFLSSHKL